MNTTNINLNAYDQGEAQQSDNFDYVLCYVNGIAQSSAQLVASQEDKGVYWVVSTILSPQSKTPYYVALPCNRTVAFLKNVNTGYEYEAMALGLPAYLNKKFASMAEALAFIQEETI